MNTFNKVSFLFVSMLLFISCQDKIYDENVDDKNIVKDNAFHKEINCQNFIPSIIQKNYSINNNLKSTNLNGIRIKKISTKNLNNGRLEYRFDVNSKEKLIPISSLTKIYLGAIYSGVELEKGKYNSKPYATNSFNVSISAPLKNVRANIDRASLSKQRESIRNFFSKEPINQKYVPEEFEFSIDQFSSYEELQFVLNSELDTNGFQSTDITNNKVKKKTGLYLKCLQRNFSLDMSLPTSGTFIKSPAVIGADQPIYVSSISFGKITLLAIESDYSYKEAQEAFRRVTRKFLYKETITITRKDIEIVNNSTISVFSMGENGSGFKAIKGYQALIENISSSGEWGNYTSNNPGVPLYASFSHLKDDSSVDLVYDFKINLPPIFARIEYKNIFTNNGNKKLYQKVNAYLTFYSDPRAFNKTLPLNFIKINLRKRELEIPYIEGGGLGTLEILEYIKNLRATAKENYSTLQTFYVKDRGWMKADNLIEKDFIPVDVFNLNYYDMSEATGIPGLAAYDFGFKLRIYSIEKDWFYKILPPHYGIIDYGYYS